MNVIRANCRVQFTAEDLDFIREILGSKIGDREGLSKLLADEESRDLILDDEQLFRAVLERSGCLRISSHLYFYILVRQVLYRSGIAERQVADYVAEVLTAFSRAEQMQCVVRGQPQPLNYFFEMLAAIQTADEVSSFHIRAHVGNYSLFLSGVFPDHIRHRAERRGAPGLKYYEELGQASFRVARDHRLARAYELTDVFDTLSDQFQTARLALNDLGDRLLSLGDPGDTFDQLLHTAMKTGL